ncbi:rubredoxin [Fusobacteria bacterium ZRK30]|nr:rubredoxin [Fusobacteria bacterium ZRK30]
MEKWVCTVCGYVYNSEIGHPKSGVEKGTKWEDLPENWICPLCAVNKDQFEKIEKQRDVASK